MYFQIIKHFILTPLFYAQENSNYSYPSKTKKNLSVFLAYKNFWKVQQIESKLVCIGRIYSSAKNMA